MQKQKISVIIKQFGKAQISSVIATLGDFLLTAALFHYCHLQEGFSTFIGSIFGGLINCFINYRWTFIGCSQRYRTVFLKYSFVWSGSILFNTWGTVFGVKLAKLYLSETLNLFLLVKAAIAILVAIFWNFNMQKYYVYKNKKI